MGFGEITFDQVKSPPVLGLPSLQGCCSSPHTRRCCLCTGGTGVLLAILGVLLLAGGKGFLEEKILHSMALSPGSGRLASWLVPPVQAHLTGYGFHVTNPEAVMRGEKPVLKEVGPFVYKAITIKDSEDQESGKPNLDFNDDGETLTYRPRKFYYLDREQSTGGDPDTTFLTVPNVPLLTAFSKIRDMSWLTKPIGKNLILAQGRGTPFINISFSGLLWGYEDEMPCMKLTKSGECYAREAEEYAAKSAAEAAANPSTGEEDDSWGSFGGDEDTDGDSWGEDFRRKRAAGRYKREAQEEISLPCTDLRTENFAALERPKGEFVDCKCVWGLFRDRNVTLRKPLKIHHGMADLSKKGWVEEFDGKKTLGWWEPESKCDQVGGQDTSTLPPGWTKDKSVDFYTPLMCRRIKLDYVEERTHLGLLSYRYIPNIQQMASPNDPDLAVRNEENSCYCVEGFSCLKSGVYNMEPCKRKPDLPRGAPIALSYPHFYQADPSYREAVLGLSPEQEKHQFFMDISPEFGFPLAIRPRFQLNAIIRKDADIEVMSGFVDELVLPFLWAQDGFDEPSPAMAKAIGMGLKLPGMASGFGVVLLCLGLGMLALCVLWVVWARRTGIQAGAETFPLS